MAWNNTQVKGFVAQVRKNVGEGWRFMTPEVRSAFIDSKALSVICSQDAETVKTDAVNELRTAMMVESNLAER